jgi:hypothetical protein
MQITPGARNLGNFFDGVKVRIPSFQRNYSWTKKQVEQFLADVYGTAESEVNHFWGPLVVLRRPEAPRELEVIDGQQRLTTAVVMLAALRDHAATLSQPMVNPGTPGQWPAFTAVRNFLFQPPTLSQPKFEGSYLIAKVLSERIIADPTTPDANGGVVSRPPLSRNGGGMTVAERKHSKELRTAYTQIQESLSKKITAQPTDAAKTQYVASVFFALTTRFEIYTLELSNEDDAFVLFESLNDRGLRLNPADILKTLTLHDISQSPGIMSVDKALETWDDAAESLGDLDFTKFLRHYLLTKTTRKVQNHRIVSEFRELIERLNPDGACKNLLDIENAAMHYSFALGITKHPDAQLAECFERMNRYSDTHRVFAIALLKTQIDMPSKRRLARAVEFLSYRWITAGQNAQELESLYQKLSHALAADQRASGVDTVVAELVKAAPDDARFISSLTENDSPHMLRYLLYRIEESQGGGLSASTDLEHLAPQSPAAHSAYWHGKIASTSEPDASGLLYENYVDSWGNITLLESKLNKSIKNSEWPQKVAGVGNYKGLNASNYSVNSTLKTLPEWTGEMIRHRESWLTECALSLVSTNWVDTGVATVAMWNPNAAAATGTQ